MADTDTTQQTTQTQTTAGTTATTQTQATATQTQQTTTDPAEALKAQIAEMQAKLASLETGAQSAKEAADKAAADLEAARQARIDEMLSAYHDEARDVVAKLGDVNPFTTEGKEKISAALKAKPHLLRTGGPPIAVESVKIPDINPGMTAYTPEALKEIMQRMIQRGGK